MRSIPLSINVSAPFLRRKSFALTLTTYLACFRLVYGSIDIGQSTEKNKDDEQRFLLRRINNRHFQATGDTLRRQEIRKSDNLSHSTRRLAKRCKANPNCAHLEGDCCPTSEGVTLECCMVEVYDVSTSTVAEVSTSTGGSSSIASCSAHPQL
jgi:hypothetical protein